MYTSFNFDSTISDVTLHFKSCLSVSAGLRRIVVYVLYGVLLLLLLILLMVTGIRCTTLNSPMKLIYEYSVRCLSYHITIVVSQSLPVKQWNRWRQTKPWKDQQWRDNFIVQFRSGNGFMFGCNDVQSMPSVLLLFKFVVSKFQAQQLCRRSSYRNLSQFKVNTESFTYQ